MTMNQNQNVVSPEVFGQAMGGIPVGQPAQQLFVQPTQQQPTVQSPTVQAMQQQQVQPNPMQQPNIQQGWQTVQQQIQPQQQVAQAAAAMTAATIPQPQVPVDPYRQAAYDAMTKDTSEFIKGMMDAVVPLIAQKAYEQLTDEQKLQLAQKHANENSKKEDEEEDGFFDGILGKGLMLAALGGLGYYGYNKLAEDGNEVDDVAALGSAFATLLS